MQNFMHSFFSEASAKGARSTALHALQWVIAMLLTSIPVTSIAGSPLWLLIALSGALGVILVTFIGAYIYFLIKSPDALRSESYTLFKMAIERGLVGDNLSGLRDEKSIEGLINETKQLSAGEEDAS